MSPPFRPKVGGFFSMLVWQVGGWGWLGIWVALTNLKRFLGDEGFEGFGEGPNEGPGRGVWVTSPKARNQAPFILRALTSNLAVVQR